MNNIKVIHVKRQKLIKIKNREWVKNESRHRYVSRTDICNISLNVKEVKYTKSAINLMVCGGEYYYSDTFNEYYKTLSNARKKVLETAMVFKDETLTISEPMGLYFISDWGKVRVDDN